MSFNSWYINFNLFIFFQTKEMQTIYLSYFCCNNKLDKGHFFTFRKLLYYQSHSTSLPSLQALRCVIMKAGSVCSRLGFSTTTRAISILRIHTRSRSWSGDNFILFSFWLLSLCLYQAHSLHPNLNFPPQNSSSLSELHLNTSHPCLLVWVFLKLHCRWKQVESNGIHNKDTDMVGEERCMNMTVSTKKHTKCKIDCLYQANFNESGK